MYSCEKFFLEVTLVFGLIYLIIEGIVENVYLDIDYKKQYPEKYLEYLYKKIEFQ